MVVASATYEKDSTLFIRDFLRTNLTDTQTPARAGSAWIFSGWPETTPTYPIVIVDAENISDVRALGQQSQGTLTEVTYKIGIFAKRLTDRSTLSQNTTNLLRSNQLTASGTCNFQMFNYQIINSVNVDEDGTDALHRRILRVKYDLILT